MYNINHRHNPAVSFPLLACIVLSVSSNTNSNVISCSVLFMCEVWSEQWQGIVTDSTENLSFRPRFWDKTVFVASVASDYFALQNKVMQIFLPSKISWKTFSMPHAMMEIYNVRIWERDHKSVLHKQVLPTAWNGPRVRQGEVMRKPRAVSGTCEVCGGCLVCLASLGWPPSQPPFWQPPKDYLHNRFFLYFCSKYLIDSNIFYRSCLDDWKRIQR